MDIPSTIDEGLIPVLRTLFGAIEKELCNHVWKFYHYLGAAVMPLYFCLPPSWHHPHIFKTSLLYRLYFIGVSWKVSEPLGPATPDAPNTSMHLLRAGRAWPGPVFLQDPQNIGDISDDTWVRESAHPPWSPSFAPRRNTSFVLDRELRTLTVLMISSFRIDDEVTLCHLQQGISLMSAYNRPRLLNSKQPRIGVSMSHIHSGGLWLDLRHKRWGKKKIGQEKKRKFISGLWDRLCERPLIWRHQRAPWHYLPGRQSYHHALREGADHCGQ